VSQSDIEAALAAGGVDSGTPDNASGASGFPHVEASKAMSVQTTAADPPSRIEASVDAARRQAGDADAMAHAPIPGSSASGQARSTPQAAMPAGSIALELPDFGGGARNDASGGVELLSDVDLHVKVELGRADMAIEDVLRLGSGSIVELDKLAGDPVDVLVNDRLVARGEVLILNDNFCVRISEIVAADVEVDG
jgi:flagellar motor switch protein FliN/FliY